MRRRTLFASAAILAAPAILGRAARAAGGQIIVGTWAGDYGNLLKANVQDPILVPKGYEVIQDAGDEPPRIAKMIAQKRLPHGTVDVACVQAVAAYQLNALELLEKLDESKVPNLKNVRADLRTDYFAPHIWSPQVLIYNPDRVPNPPTSFGDLLDPKYKGKIGFPDVNAFYVMMAASLYGSGTSIDFDKAKELAVKLNAQEPHLYPSTDQAGPPFKTGEIDVGVMWLARVNMWQNSGIPVKASFPKEGCILYVSGMVVAKNAPNKEGAFAYLDAMLEPSAQQRFAERMGYLPTVTNAPLTGKVGEQLALPNPQPKLVVPDFAYTSKVMADIQEWWKKTTAHN
ncbi:MAG: PotD/PotF family extracellular solute-binding protein, partial [Nevskiales bacterium]